MSFSVRHRCQCVSKALQGHLGAVAAPPALIKALQCRKERGNTLLSEYGNDLRHPLLAPTPTSPDAQKRCSGDEFVLLLFMLLRQSIKGTRLCVSS